MNDEIGLRSVTQPRPIEKVRWILPTLGDAFAFVMAAYKDIHVHAVSAASRGR